MHCLDDRTLLELRDDKASAEAREHVCACVACTRRAALLERDLALVTRVVRDAPMPPTKRHPSFERFALAAVAILVIAALAAASALYVRRIGQHRNVASHSTRAPRAADAWRLEEMSQALFALDPLDPAVRIRRANDLGLVQAALGGIHPCERAGTASACEW